MSTDIVIVLISLIYIFVKYGKPTINNFGTTNHFYVGLKKGSPTTSEDADIQLINQILDELQRLSEVKENDHKLN